LQIRHEKVGWRQGVARLQGDQIGRLLAHWEMVCFGHFLSITEVAKNFDAMFSAVKIMHNFWETMGWATLLGDFFTNSSGHPAPLHGCWAKLSLKLHFVVTVWHLGSILWF
jgi:hypothetical protein